MNRIIKISLATALALTAAAPVVAQDVPNRLRTNIIETYAAYAAAYAEVSANPDAGGAKREMNVKRAEFVDLCTRAELDYAGCVVAFIPTSDRTQPDQAFGEQGENLVRNQNNSNNGNQNNNGGNANNNGGNNGNNNNGNNGNNGGNNDQNADTRAVRQAASNYTDAVNALNQSISSGQGNTNRLRNRAQAAYAELDEACESIGLSNVNRCLQRLNLSVPDMPNVPVRESDDENAAAILDSQKEAENSGRPSTPPIGIDFNIEVPLDDRDSQANLNNQPVISVQEEQGTRIDLQPIEQRPSGRIIEDLGDRQVVEQNGQVVVSNQENTRLTVGSEQTYYENISRNRVRETIVRPNGVRLVTIRNANGDILQRSRFEPDGTETVLVYVAPDQEQQVLANTDPGQNLPPLQLGISAEDYILDADEADLNQVIDFLDSPPVERLQRYYSIDEVKRSARIRDMVRRLEIGNLTFEFGSANLAPDQVNGLYTLASAIQTMLQQNPGEVFLIEGHTDAVGSIAANLVLSDRRAENVARLLTEAYGIPPENLATQGYGERYLKINTPYEERLNRRVTVKRITPLIAPIPNYAAG